ncbi:MAG: hypothetical protein WA776_01555 [Xanthobacteraceae bacterium]
MKRHSKRDAKADGHWTIEMAKTNWTQFRTMKKCKNFNILLAGKKFSAKGKMRFDERR